MLVGLLHPITAAGGSTVMTGIGWVFIAVITTFPRPHHAITTASDGAVVQAGIPVFFIAVIAAFEAWLTFDQITAVDSVPAASLRTAGRATVVVVPIAIVADFEAHLVDL